MNSPAYALIQTDTGSRLAFLYSIGDHRSRVAFLDPLEQKPPNPRLVGWGGDAVLVGNSRILATWDERPSAADVAMMRRRRMPYQTPAERKAAREAPRTAEHFAILNRHAAKRAAALKAYRAKIAALDPDPFDV